jgi:ATP-dependent helicase HrpA
MSEASSHAAASPLSSISPRANQIPDNILLADRGRLITLDRKRRDFIRAGKPHDQLDQKFDAELKLALERYTARKARHALIAHPTFDDALPIAERRHEIAALIRKHQVVILCGETGSGKTTQLPKICLELGRGMNGMIGCTQPRRIAARSLATRLAQELKQTGSHTVAYKIRFNDHTDDSTFVKVMTDGILLAETHSDHALRKYDTLIIDEAHERSLNIDFLLGYVKRLIVRRPDLKVIITSATIDPYKFAKHFATGVDDAVLAPVIEVSGRTYPVEVRYRPEHFLDDADDAVDIEDAVVRAVDELLKESHQGDVLVFLPGEREIRDCAEALRKRTVNAPGAGARAHLEVLPLYSRLTNQEQDRVFQLRGRRRIVLATNVAETSLTVPGIRYVIDAGVARINRYSARSKINQLQIEPISQASAKQRAGRCGRVAEGIAIRLYSEEDHDARPAFTTPEILRTSLAAVILRMKALDLGEIADFPFIEPPSSRMIEDGYRQLFELGAVDEAKALTPLGATLAKFPVDPALARMLIAAAKESALKEVLIIASALSVQDPRNRPHDKQQESQVAHEKFANPQSEFLAFIKMWEFYDEALKHKKSNRKFDQMLIENFLSPLRMREWRDVHAQLADMVAAQNMKLNVAPARFEEIHRALLTGLLANVGTKAIEGDHYLGTRGLKFQLPRAQQQHAGQKATRMKWVMAAELTETTRVYARTVASIEPEWIEQLAAHLVTRTHHDPHWERKSGQVVAFEQVALYGLIVNPRKRIHYGAIKPIESREIFIRQGLVAGEVDTHGKFLHNNMRLVDEIEDIENKARRQDVLIDEDEMVALYDAIIPADVVNMAGFERWRKEAERTNANVLMFSREQLMRRTASEITFDLFPKSLKTRGATYPLSYRFEPTHPLDGVTITLPVAVLNQVPAARFDWLVMGMLREKVAAVIKTLPQRLRSPLVPVPDTVSEFIEHILKMDGMRDLSAAEAPLTDAITVFLKRAKNIDPPKDAWDLSRITTHLNMNFKIVDADGKELAMSRDFAALKLQFADASRTVFSTLHSNRLEQDNLVRWPNELDELPTTINFEKSGIRYDGYPSLMDHGNDVSIRILDEPLLAKHNHRRGLTRLFMLEAPEQAKFAERSIRVSPIAAFQFASYFPEAKNHAQDAMRMELVFAAFAMTFVDLEGEGVRTREDFTMRRDKFKTKVIENTQLLTAAIDEAFTLTAEVKKLLDERYVKGWEHIGPDVEAQLKHLFSKEFLRETRGTQLLYYPRYLKAIAMRINKAKQGAMERDLEQFKSVRPLWQNWLGVKNQLEAEIADYRWLVEELRVSLFAQELRTPMPVSVKRVTKVWDELQK